MKPANEVHHKKPLSEGGEKYNFMNLAALCKKCHSRHKKGNEEFQSFEDETELL